MLESGFFVVVGLIFFTNPDFKAVLSAEVRIPSNVSAMYWETLTFGSYGTY